MSFDIGLNPRELFAILLVMAVSAIVYFDRSKIKRHYILFYRRTERGIDFIDRLARNFPRFWSIYGKAATLTGAISILVGTLLFARTIGKMVLTKSTTNGPSAVLPSLGSEVTIQPGVSFIPIEYWVIGVGILMVFHEMSHGVIARANDFEINSVGWIIMGIIPGAFVEPKSGQMLPGADVEGDSDGIWDQGTWKQRLEVVSAGSFANYIVAAVFILAHFLMLNAVSSPSDVIYTAQEGFPAHSAGMSNGTLIEIDGEKIEDVEDVMRISSSIEPNESLSIWSSEGNFTMEAAVAPDTTREAGGMEGLGSVLGKPEEKDGEDGYIGVKVGTSRVLDDRFEKNEAGVKWFLSLIYTVGILNLLIGLFNLMPLKPLDGGLYLDTVVREFWPERVSAVDRISALGWAVILGSLLMTIVTQAI